MTKTLHLFQKNYPVPVPDHYDLEIAQVRFSEYEADPLPRVGDFVRMPDGGLERFAYRWENGAGWVHLQTCNYGSFYLGHGYASMSGGLNPGVPLERIESTEEKQDGDFWFFHHDHATAHYAVGVRLPCRVYRIKPEVSV